MNKFIRILKSRRSVRKFKSKKVPMRIIENLIEYATYAPTNCNQQLWKFIVIDKQSIKQKLVEEAFSNTNIQRAPIIIVSTYDSWNKKEALQGASLATQNILLGATNAGLGSLPLNSYGNDKKIKKILNIPQNYIINCFILVGYTDNIYKKIPSVNRRPVKEVMSLNTFESNFPSVRSYNPEKWTKDQLIDYQKYYCRKTTPGKEMDIMDDLEKKLVNYTLSNIEKEKKTIDFFSYDGCYLNLFPNNSTTSVNLEKETENYVKSSIETYCPDKKTNMSFKIFDNLNGKFDTATIIFKFERISQNMRNETYKKIKEILNNNGELIIIVRKNNFLFNIYYFIIKILFGDDIRKTGIYAFWGPYRPVNIGILLKELKDHKFKIEKIKNYFPFPPFFNQVYQMFLQWIKSGGTTYLHRKKHKDFITKLLRYLTNVKKIKSNYFGSVVVIKAKYNK